MSSETGFVIATAALFLVIMFTAVAWASRRDDRYRDAAEQRIENDKCALRGLVLLRGQAGEFVCVTPGAEKYRRKP